MECCSLAATKKSYREQKFRTHLFYSLPMAGEMNWGQMTAMNVDWNESGWIEDVHVT